MKQFHLVLFLIFIGIDIYAQSASEASSEFHFIGDINGTVKEVSGIVCTANGDIFVIGDSGNSPVVYQINDLAEVINEIDINNVKNTDWEELQLDHEGTLYIADIGNNLGHRNDLTIYKIPSYSDSVNVSSISISDSIRYTYPDQNLPLVANSLTNFDCEAFIVFNDEIHLFSKNHGTSNYTKRYSLENVIGVQEAVLVDSTMTNNWITGAYYKTSDDELFLLSDHSVTVYENYSTEGLNSVLCSLEYPTTQLEGITQNQYQELLLAEDIENGESSKLYKSLLNCNLDSEVSIYPNPSTSYINWNSSKIVYAVSIYDSKGKIVKSKSFLTDDGINGKKTDSMNIRSLLAGTYILKFKFLNNTELNKRFIVK